MSRYEWDNMDAETEKQKAKDLIAKSEHIALLLPPRPSIDCLAAAEVLSRALGAGDKQVGFLPSVSIDAPRPPEVFTRILNPRSLTREFIIAIDTTASPVAQLRYEKRDDRIEIILSPKSFPIREDAFSFTEGKLQCDCLIALGIPDIEALPTAGLGITPQFFTETPIIALSNLAQQKPYAEVNLLSAEEAPLSELAYEFIKTVSGGAPKPEEATLLYSGFLHHTRNFRSPILISTHLAAAELLQIGADPTAAGLLAQADRPFPLLQLVARASVRSKEDPHRRTLWSFLTAEDFEKTSRRDTDTLSVLEALDGFFPPHPVGVLLWQDLYTRRIRGMLRGPKPMLAALATREPGQIHSPALVLDTDFADFMQAEERISALLDQVLSDTIL